MVYTVFVFFFNCNSYFHLFSFGQFNKVATNEDLSDVLERVKFSCLCWTHDGKGVFYNVSHFLVEISQIPNLLQQMQLWQFIEFFSLT